MNYSTVIPNLLSSFASAHPLSFWLSFLANATGILWLANRTEPHKKFPDTTPTKTFIFLSGGSLLFLSMFILWNLYTPAVWLLVATLIVLNQYSSTIRSGYFVVSLILTATSGFIAQWYYQREQAFNGAIAEALEDFYFSFIPLGF